MNTRPRSVHNRSHAFCDKHLRFMKTAAKRPLFLGLGLSLGVVVFSPSVRAQGTFSSTASGAYNANATFGGAGNPANGTADNVTINNTVSILNATDAALDNILFGSGGAGIINLLPSSGDANTTFSVGTLDFSIGNATLEVSRSTTTGAAAITDTLNATSFTLGNGKTLTLATGANSGGFSSNITVTGTGTLNGNQIFAPATNGQNRDVLTFTGVISDGTTAGSVTKTGDGSLAFTAANTYTGATQINRGNLILSGTGSIANSAVTIGTANSSTAIFPASSGAVSAALQFVDTGVTGSITRTNGITINPHILASNASSTLADLRIDGPTSGATTVNDLAGKLTLNTGAGFAIFAQNANPISSTAASLLTFDSLTRNSGSMINVEGNPGTKIGTLAIASANAGSFNLVFTNNANVLASLAGGGGSPTSTTTSVLPFAVVSNTVATYDTTYGLHAQINFGALTNANTNTTDNVRLTTGAVSLTTGATVNSLQINGGTIDGAGTLNITSGVIASNIAQDATASIGATTPGIINFGTREGFISANGDNGNGTLPGQLNIGSVITGSGGMNFDINRSAGRGGTGAIVLSGANTYTGTTRFVGTNVGDAVVLRNGLAFQNTTVDYNNNGGSFAFGDNTAAPTAYTFGGLTGVQNINLSNSAATPTAVTLTLGSAGSADTAATVNTYSGVLSSATTPGANTTVPGSIIKAGVATQIFSGANTYTGTTTVNGGTLGLDSAGTTTARLTATSNVTVNTGGILQLVNSTATASTDRINNAATVTLNGGTINTGGLSEGLATTTARTTGLGALTLSSSSTLDFGLGHAGSSVLAFANSASQMWAGSLALTDFTAGTDFLNFASSTGLTATQLGEITYNNGTSSFVGSGLDTQGNVIFSMAAVPEPSTWATGLALCLVAVVSPRGRALLKRRVA